MKNSFLKVLSLALAILLALFVHYSLQNENAASSMVQLIVPVEVQNLSRDQVITHPITRQAEVTLRGSSSSLARIVTSPPIFRVEVPPGVKERFIAVLRKDDLRVGGDVEILSIRPAEIEFKIDTLVRRTVPVVVPRIGALVEGLVVERIVTRPEEVVLRGPENELKGINAVETLPLDLRELVESGERILSVRVPGSLTEAESSSVEVSVRLGQKAKEVLMRGLPVELRAPSGVMVGAAPAQVSVVVMGPEAVLSQMEAGQVVPFVRIGADETAFLPFEREVKAEVPPEVSVLRIDPMKVRVVQSGPKKAGAPKR